MGGVSSKRTICIGEESFQMHRVLGKGAYGIVRCVEDERTKTLYACKELRKQWLLAKGTKAISCALTERQMLCELSSPYIVKLHWALQDDNALYMVLIILPSSMDSPCINKNMRLIN
tara:strand:- start:444 stop:794 length:351 start_codon:yes stop_codon:yes gene_type:complete